MSLDGLDDLPEGGEVAAPTMSPVVDMQDRILHVVRPDEVVPETEEQLPELGPSEIHSFEDLEAHIRSQIGEHLNDSREVQHFHRRKLRGSEMRAFFKTMNSDPDLWQHYQEMLARAGSFETTLHLKDGSTGRLPLRMAGQLEALKHSDPQGAREYVSGMYLLHAHHITRLKPLLAAAATHPLGRALLEISIDRQAEKDSRRLREKLHAGHKYIEHLVIGAGPEGAAYNAETLHSAPGKSRLCITDDRMLGGQFRRSGGPAHYMNTKNRLAAESVMDLDGLTSLNPSGVHAPIAMQDISGELYTMNDTAGMTAALVQLFSGDTMLNMRFEDVDVNTDPEQRGKYRVTLHDLETDTLSTIYTDQITAATGAGEDTYGMRHPSPESLAICEEEKKRAARGEPARIYTAAQLFERVAPRSNMFPLEDFVGKEIIIVGDGHAAHTIEELLHGQVDPRGSVSTLGRPKSITILNSKYNDPEEFCKYELSRYGMLRDFRQLYPMALRLFPRASLNQVIHNPLEPTLIGCKFTNEVDLEVPTDLLFCATERISKITSEQSQQVSFIDCEKAVVECEMLAGKNLTIVGDRHAKQIIELLLFNSVSEELLPASITIIESTHISIPDLFADHIASSFFTALVPRVKFLDRSTMKMVKSSPELPTSLSVECYKKEDNTIAGEMLICTTGQNSTIHKAFAKLHGTASAESFAATLDRIQDPQNAKKTIGHTLPGHPSISFVPPAVAVTLTDDEAEYARKHSRPANGLALYNAIPCTVKVARIDAEQNGQAEMSEADRAGLLTLSREQSEYIRVDADQPSIRELVVPLSRRACLQKYSKDLPSGTLPLLARQRIETNFSIPDWMEDRRLSVSVPSISGNTFDCIVRVEPPLPSGTEPLLRAFIQDPMMQRAIYLYTDPRFNPEGDSAWTISLRLGTRNAGRQLHEPLRRKRDYIQERPTPGQE